MHARRLSIDGARAHIGSATLTRFAPKNQSFPMGTTYGTYSAYVPEYTDCAVIFYIDKAGTMLRYDMKTTGKISYNACGEYISGFRF